MYLTVLNRVSPAKQTDMQLLDLTLPTPAENLALDEALLELATQENNRAGCLRLWEPSTHFVVLGRSSQSAEEVAWPYCRGHQIPVLRRCSGGASVVAGPGCLMYAVVLSYAQYPALMAIDAAHKHALSIHVAALRDLGIEAKCAGTSDLAIAGRKVSGNSLRCKRTHFLYHGTFLCQFDLALIEACLGRAPRQPDYRQGRTHSAFVTNLGLETGRLKTAIARRWGALEPLEEWPELQTRELVTTRYSQDEWNLRL